MFSRLYFLNSDILSDLFLNGLDETYVNNTETIYPTKKEDYYQYEVDLPGVKKEDISIKVEKSLCTITARRKRKNETYNISRYFYLPKHVDKEGISATMVDGVLKLIVKEKVPENEKPMIVKLE